MPTIFTHSGSAHRDELVACAVILAKEHGSSLRWQIRRVAAFDPADATDFDYVVDIGGVYDPQALRFDHHQDPALPSSASLVMRHFGILDAAYEWYPWVEFMDIVDVNGPGAAAGWLDTRISTLARLHSPVELAVLHEFEKAALVEPGSFLYDMLLLLGRDIVDGLSARVDRMKLLEHRAVVEWHDGHPLCIYFLDDVPNPELALRMFRIRQARNALVGVTVDLRGPGWCMFRFDDRSGVDFRRVACDPDVAFVHATGFLATTKTRCPTDTLRTLVRRAAGVEGT